MVDPSVIALAMEANGGMCTGTVRARHVHPDSPRTALSSARVRASRLGRVFHASSREIHSFLHQQALKRFRRVGNRSAGDTTDSQNPDFESHVDNFTATGRVEVQVM